VRRVVLSATTIAALIATASCAAVTTPADGGRPGRTSATTGVADTTTPPPPTTALSLCRLALPSRDAVSGTWTTVSGLRSWGFSGPVQKRPLRDVFPSASPADLAVWCWTKDARDRYTAWGVRPQDPPQHAITVTGPTTVTPSGPPRIP
jgi:hypothetical protein